MVWLRRLGGRPEPESSDHPLTHRESTPAEEELRQQLADDPNDQEAFDALAALVAERASEDTLPDPLTGDTDSGAPTRHAIWALAEEVAQQPKAWLPLVVLAELSLDTDHEAAMRWLNLAVEREPDGVALTYAIAMLRDSGNLSDAVTFGVSHWEVASREAAAGREVVMAALDGGRVEEARRLYDSMIEAGGTAKGLADVGVLVERAEERAGSTAEV